MTVLDIGIIVVYFVLIIGVGVYSSKRANTTDNYLIAGQRLGYTLTLACLCAVMLGGASTIGTTALGYRFGISGMWLVSMLGLGLALVGFFLIKKIRKSNILTVAQLLTNRYGRKAGVLGAVVSSLYTMLVCATQIIAMGTILQGLAGWNPVVSMLVVGCIVIAYTILGGMWAITITDFIQFILIVIGICFIMLPFSVNAAGGFENMVNTLPSSYFDITSIGWSTIIQYFFLYCLGALVGQDIWQRYLTAKSVKVARRSGLGAGIFILFYAVACALIGMAAQVFMPGAENAQLVFADMAQGILPTGLLGVVLVSVLAVLMSTASGTLLASSSLLANDVIKPFLTERSEKKKGSVLETAESDKRDLRVSKKVTALIGAIAMVIAVALNDVLVALDVSYAILSGALFFPIILGIFWKKTSSKAALIAIAVSSVVVLGGLAIMGTSAIEPIACGLVVGLILMVSITVFETRKNKDLT